MTEKLYQQDSHLLENTAVVQRVTAVPGGYEVVLDRTVLFPAGGGQPCDLGTIGPANVLDVREQGEEAIHLVDRPLTVGETVQVQLDWERRFDYMQQHTGEHLLSFAAYRLYGVHNVGFHLADGYTTIDFDQPISGEALHKTVDLANSYVWRDLGVSAVCYASEEEIRDLPLRKHAEGLTAPIRIVSIEDADCCTCCAPHCKRTGEVGGILITDAIAYKGGVRITFLCGKRALLYARTAHETLDGLARRFSCSREDAEGAVKKQGEELAACKRDMKAMAHQLNEYLAREIHQRADTAGGHQVIVRLMEHLDGGRLRELAQTALGQDGMVALFSMIDGKLSYVLTTSKGFPIDASELIAPVNAATGGKGGGRGTLAQGMAVNCPCPEETVEQLRQYFLKRLQARA